MSARSNLLVVAMVGTLFLERSALPCVLPVSLLGMRAGWQSICWYVCPTHFRMLQQLVNLEVLLYYTMKRKYNKLENIWTVFHPVFGVQSVEVSFQK